MAAGAGRTTRRRSSGTAVGDGSTAVGEPPADDPGTPPETPVAPSAAPDPAEGADPLAETDPDDPARSIAERRRAALNKAPAPHPAGAPAAGVTSTVVTDRATLDELSHGGSPARPVGGVWSGRPVVLETHPGAVGGVRTGVSDYVIAEFDAVESTIMPGCKTPVSKKVWRAGMLVRRDVYEGVRAVHEQRLADGTAGLPQPARLPAEVTAVPPDVVATGPGAGVTSADPAATAAQLEAESAAQTEIIA